MPDLSGDTDSPQVSSERTGIGPEMASGIVVVLHLFRISSMSRYGNSPDTMLIVAIMSGLDVQIGSWSVVLVEQLPSLVLLAFCRGRAAVVCPTPLLYCVSGHCQYRIGQTRGMMTLDSKRLPPAFQRGS